MAQAIYAEAGAESFEGKRAVGHVILNRAKKGRFGARPCVVVKQPRQFKYRIGRGKNWEDSIRAAKNLGSDVTNGALYFKNLRSKVKWNYSFVKRIGGHLFYK